MFAILFRTFIHSLYRHAGQSETEDFSFQSMISIEMLRISVGIAQNKS